MGGGLEPYGKICPIYIEVCLLVTRSIKFLDICQEDLNVYLSVHYHKKHNCQNKVMVQFAKIIFHLEVE